MGAVTITDFGGIIPRRSERLLPNNAAQVAVNCNLSSGELTPFKSPSRVHISAKSGPLLNINRIVDGASAAWLTWPFDVDVVKAPLFGTPCWVFTGDGEPRITNMAMATAGAGYPYSYNTLGTPQPITAPGVSHSGGVGSATDRLYCYTFYSTFDGKEFEGAVSPASTLITGKVDGTWSITGMDAAPPNSGTVTGVFASGETTFTDTVNHWLRVGEQVVIDGVTLAVTAVTSTKIFKVAGDYSAETAWSRKAPFATTVKRLYRTTGTTGQWQAVAEGITGTSYSDTLTDAQILGDELISADWAMPPVDIKALIVLPSQALAAISGNKVVFSEPNQPHAWPTKYAIQLDYDGVALSAFGNNIGVATTSIPTIITGTEPGQMTAQGAQEVHPCLSKRSMVSLGDMAIYAAPSGLVAISPSGVSVWSIAYFTEKEWTNFNPATMVGAMYGRRLYMLYQYSGSTRILIFNLMGDQSYLTEAHISADEIYSDMTDGRLYVSFGSGVYEVDPLDGYNLVQDWMSKEIVLPDPANLGAALVSFQLAVDPAQIAALQAERTVVELSNNAIVTSGIAHGAWNGFGYNVKAFNTSDIEPLPDVPPDNKVTFQYYANGVLKSTREVSNRKPFSLPSGFKANRVAVRVSSNCRIESIELGATKQSIGTTPQ